MINEIVKYTIASDKLPHQSSKVRLWCNIAMTNTAMCQSTTTLAPESGTIQQQLVVSILGQHAHAVLFEFRLVGCAVVAVSGKTVKLVDDNELKALALAVLNHLQKFGAFVCRTRQGGDTSTQGGKHKRTQAGLYTLNAKCLILLMIFKLLNCDYPLPR